MSSVHSSFEQIEDTVIGEYQTRARRFVHRTTGADILSLENEDENKVFGITFRTPPADSTGVAHILEHSVLCGSRKYPVKEPFVELLKSSLQTFLNAFTYPDKTCYPVASQNLKDFYNLIDVYLDAVFFPRLTPHVLQQEGWHYEWDSKNRQLHYKGVVFNEMKGAYSSADRRVLEFSQTALFPDTTYGFDSGGDPKIIPQLTFAQFTDFHQTYYHPSNAKIYFYGDDPVEQRLTILDSFLSGFKRKKVDSGITEQKRFTAPQRKAEFYAASQEDASSRKGYVTVSWLLPEVYDPVDALSLKILERILIGSNASPLKTALIESGLGDDLIGAGLEDELREPYFSAGLRGVDTRQAEKVEELIFATLKRLVDKGIDPQTTLAAFNTIEFRLRENNTGSFPRGLVVMLRALTNWLYGRHPLASLRFEEALARIKVEGIEGRGYFERLIVKHLIRNLHRVTLVVAPDSTLSDRLAAEERGVLDQIQGRLADAELAVIAREAAALKARQQKPDSAKQLAKIPRLERGDLDPRHRSIPLDIVTVERTTILTHPIRTHGICYLDLAFDLSRLELAELAWVPLLGRALLEMGCSGFDYIALSQRIGRDTGGISAGRLISARVGDERVMARLLLRGKALIGTIDGLLAILVDISKTVHLDQRDRFRKIVAEERARLEAAIVPSGHHVVEGRLAAAYHLAGWIEESCGGIDYLAFLKIVQARIESDWPAVITQLQAAWRAVIVRDGLVVNLTADPDQVQLLTEKMRGFIDTLPVALQASRRWEKPLTPRSEGLVTQSSVNYVGKGTNFVELGFAFEGSMLVVNRWLKNGYLWNKVRVEGGAYGGFSRLDRRAGLFCFVSYRDPNLLDTIQVYDRTSDFLRAQTITDRLITESIIGTIGDLDGYMLPDQKGVTSMVRYLTGEDDEKLQAIRDQVLATTANDFRRFAGLLDKVRDQGTVVVLGNEAAIERANAEGKGFLTLVRIN